MLQQNTMTTCRHSPDIYTTSYPPPPSQSLLAHPRQPQCVHCMPELSSLSRARGTRQMHAVLKLCSLACMQRMQHSFS